MKRLCFNIAKDSFKIKKDVQCLFFHLIAFEYGYFWYPILPQLTLYLYDELLIDENHFSRRHFTLRTK